jgi:hypothetical protein
MLKMQPSEYSARIDDCIIDMPDDRVPRPAQQYRAHFARHLAPRCSTGSAPTSDENWGVHRRPRKKVRDRLLDATEPRLVLSCVNPDYRVGDSVSFFTGAGFMHKGNRPIRYRKARTDLNAERNNADISDSEVSPGAPSSAAPMGEAMTTGNTTVARR